MKKILCVALFVASLGVINAQQLPNSDFETWSGGKPTGWNTLAVDIPVLGNIEVGTDALTKSTDAYSGSSALKITISDMNAMVKAALGIDMPAPGLATNGTINLDSLLSVMTQLSEGELDPSLIITLGNALENGIALTERPVALFGAGKANIVDESDMTVAVALVYSGTGAERQMIGFGMAPIAEPNYGGFCVTIDYSLNPTATPTELIALFVAFTQNSTAAPYSYMIVDKLAISYGAGINDNKLSDISVHPNPAKDVINISTSAAEYEVQIVDMLGRVVITENSKPTVNISSLTKGVYFVKVTQNGTTATEKIVVE